jgi:hypothetical protein
MAFVCSGRKLANVLQFRLLLDTLDKLASRTVLANLKGNLDHDTRQLDIGRLVECRTTRLKFKFKLVQVALGTMVLRSKVLVSVMAESSGSTKARPPPVGTGRNFWRAFWMTAS